MHEHQDFIDTCFEDTKEKYTNKLKNDLEEDNDLDFKVTKEDCE